MVVVWRWELTTFLLWGMKIGFHLSERTRSPNMFVWSRDCQNFKLHHFTVANTCFIKPCSYIFILLWLCFYSIRFTRYKVQWKHSCVIGAPLTLHGSAQPTGCLKTLAKALLNMSMDFIMLRWIGWHMDDMCHYHVQPYSMVHNTHQHAKSSVQL